MKNDDFENIGILEYLYNKKITSDEDYQKTKEKFLNKINYKFKGVSKS